MTHPACTSTNYPSHPQPRSKRSGYSLIETIMLLGVLTMATLPMLMLIERQKDFLNLANDTNMAIIYANQILDHVNPHNPCAVSYYDIGTAGAKISVLCDPQAPNAVPADFTGGGRCFTGGADLVSPPYWFIRTVEWMGPDVPNASAYSNPSVRGLRVRVDLYKQSGNAGEVPYYTDYREYELDTFRVLVGDPIGDLPAGGADADRSFHTKQAIDDHRLNWTPAYHPTSVCSDPSYYSVLNSCTVSSNNSASGMTAPPFHKYALLGSCAAADTTTWVPKYQTRFKALANTLYRVRIYFRSQNSGADCSGTTDNTKLVSCQLGFLAISSLSGALATPNRVTLMQQRVIDVGAETRRNNDQGVMKTYFVKTPANANYLEVALQNVDPSNMGSAQFSGSPSVAISGIEVTRRLDISD